MSEPTVCFTEQWKASEHNNPHQGISAEQSKAKRKHGGSGSRETEVWAKVQRPQSAEGVSAHERPRRRKKKEGETVVVLTPVTRSDKQIWHRKLAESTARGGGSESRQPEAKRLLAVKEGRQMQPRKNKLLPGGASVSPLANGGDAASGDGEGVEIEEQGSDRSLVPNILSFQLISISAL
ncbi:hypothetical protein MJG53_009167 [Ovis ammon polii x Ovis aries]|uniref:Uncharacterized protein n=2 Tax=Ovis TaxID=9935 RepID=A0AAD4YA84_OVIAM|nr:hypothetical protein MG293_010473 [Ovis ammon polii]KAI4582616.1 hypothetical protein MJG53_009167 [Ovis ammon polii x Ovis aries]